MVRLHRFVALLVLLGAIVVLSGCVYLRLLEVKRQLADFDHNFDLTTRDGLTLSFRHPVLLDEDVESFFKWVPDSRQRTRSAERWQFRWTKEPVAADGDAPPVEIAIDVLFSDHRLVRIHAPEAFFAATMPKPLAIAALRSLGHAKVDRKQRQAQSTLDPADLQEASNDPFFTQAGIREALGAPVRIVGSEAAPEWCYRFAPASPRQRFGSSGQIETVITFDGATGRMRMMKGQTAFGTVVFDASNLPGGTVRRRL